MRVRLVPSGEHGAIVIDADDEVDQRVLGNFFAGTLKDRLNWKSARSVRCGPDVCRLIIGFEGEEDSLATFREGQ